MCCIETFMNVKILIPKANLPIFLKASENLNTLASRLPIYLHEELIGQPQELLLYQNHLPLSQLIQQREIKNLLGLGRLL